MSNRGKDESTSAYGQYIHDNYSRTFHYLDRDSLIVARSRRILRYIEVKEGEEIKPSQHEVLPLLAELIRYGVRTKLLKKESGVFILYWKHTSPDEGMIQRVIPSRTSLGDKDHRCDREKCQILEGKQWDRFNEGRAL